MQIPVVIFGFSLAALFCLALTPLVARMAVRRELRDLPGRLKPHVGPRPNAGGLAIYGAVVCSLAATVLAFPHLRTPSLTTLLPGIFLSGGLVVVLGLIDDLQGSLPAKKLTTQGLAVLVLALHAQAAGSGPALTGLAQVGAGLLLLVWMVGLTNAMNLIDGVDGLAAGVAAIMGLGLAALALSLGRAEPALVAAAVAGACLAFLRSNAYPARIFMGDTGSMFLGFVLGAVGAGLLAAAPTLTTLLGLVLVAWVPILDALYAVLRRWARHESIFRGDLGHIHHRLLAAGFSPRAAGLSLCGLALLGAAAGVATILHRHVLLWTAALLMATLPLVWILRPQGVQIRRDKALGRRPVSQDRAA